MERIKVKNVVIGKQFENSDNYKRFVKIIEEKNIKVKVVEAGEKMNIEKDLYFDILWPDSKNIITDNILNNNSLVCKLTYKNFSALFTGDIEEFAEKSILEKYAKRLNILKATVLKAAHHGSKTSSIKELLEVVEPRISLIGVGKNNKFGHPSEQIIERLIDNNCSIYRTDENGEIAINTDGNIIKIKKTL